MQADEQKDLETNSLVESFSSLKSKIDGRTLYYMLGTVFLIVAGVLLFRYFVKQKTLTRDAIVLEIEAANSRDSLKKIMEDHRGTIFGSIAKIHLARLELNVDGLEKIGTDKLEDRNKAASSLENAREHYSALTKELQKNEEPALLQEAWVGLARAEEALVGLPTKEGAGDSRGDADKAIEAYLNAGKIFPELELSKSYGTKANQLKENKSKFIETQKAFYTIIAPPAPPTLPTVKPADPKVTPPVIPELKLPDPIVPPVKAPETPAPKKEPEPKKAEPEAKKVDPPKTK